MTLDFNRYIVLAVAWLSIGTLEYGLTENTNYRRVDSSVRNEGAFFYVFFRHLNLLAQFVLYLPSAYIIEIYGVNRSFTLATILGAFGMWMHYIRLFTFAQIMVSCALPFATNCITTISSRWFGPKGRNTATGLLLLAFYLP